MNTTNYCVKELTKAIVKATTNDSFKFSTKVADIYRAHCDIVELIKTSPNRNDKASKIENELIINLLEDMLFIALETLRENNE